MDVDPTADIREIGILLLQLFHESGGEWSQNVSHTHTMTKQHSVFYWHVSRVNVCSEEDTHASVMVSIRIPMKRFFTALVSETICKCVNTFSPTRMALQKKKI